MSQIFTFLHEQWSPLLDLADTYHDMLNPMVYKRSSGEPVRCQLTPDMDFQKRRDLFITHVSQLSPQDLRKNIQFMDAPQQKNMIDLTLDRVKDVKRDLKGVDSYEDWVMKTYQDIMLSYDKEASHALELKNIPFHQLQTSFSENKKIDLFVDALQSHDILHVLHKSKRYCYVTSEWDAAVNIPGALLLRDLEPQANASFPTVGHTGQYIQFRDNHVILSNAQGKGTSLPIEFVRLLQLSVKNLCSLMQRDSITKDMVIKHLMRSGQELAKIQKKKNNKKDSLYLTALTDFINERGVGALLDMKRSGDYGQIATVKQANAKNHRERNNRQLYLITIDRLCYLRAKHENVPCILVKSQARTVTLFHGAEGNMGLYVNYYNQKLTTWHREIEFFLAEIIPLFRERLEEESESESMPLSPAPVRESTQNLLEQINIIILHYPDTPSNEDRLTHFGRLSGFMARYQEIVKENIQKWYTFRTETFNKRVLYESVLSMLIKMKDKIMNVYMTALEPIPNEKRITELIPLLEKDMEETQMWMKALMAFFVRFEVRKSIISFPWSESSSDTFELPYVVVTEGPQTRRNTRTSLTYFFKEWTRELGIGEEDHGIHLDAIAQKTFDLYRESGHPAPTVSKKKGRSDNASGVMIFPQDDKGFTGLMTYLFHHLGIVKSLGNRGVVRISRHELDPIKVLLTSFYKAVEGVFEDDGEERTIDKLTKVYMTFTDNQKNKKKMRSSEESPQSSSPAKKAQKGGSSVMRTAFTREPVRLSMNKRNHGYTHYRLHHDSNRSIFQPIHPFTNNKVPVRSSINTRSVTGTPTAIPLKNEESASLFDAYILKDVIRYYFTLDALEIKKALRIEAPLSLAMTWLCTTLLLMRTLREFSQGHRDHLEAFIRGQTSALLVTHKLFLHKRLMNPDYHVNATRFDYMKEIEGLSFLSPAEKGFMRLYLDMYHSPLE